MQFKYMFALVAAAMLTTLGSTAVAADNSGKVFKQSDFPQQALTAPDCAAGRHWEAPGHGLSFSHCACDSDSTHTPTANNQTCPVCSGVNLVQTTYTLNADGSWGPGGAQATVQANSPLCAPPPPTATGTGCAGTTLVQNWSDGSQSVIQANAPACGYVAPVTPTRIGCLGTTQVQNWSDGSQTTLQANSTSCGFVATPTMTSTSCNGTTLMQGWSDGTQTVVESNAVACGAVVAQPGCPAGTLNWTIAGMSCSGTVAAGSAGDTSSVVNTKADFSGSATALCSSGTWITASSTCSSFSQPIKASHSFPTLAATTWMNYPSLVNPASITTNTIYLYACENGHATDISLTTVIAPIMEESELNFKYTCGSEQYEAVVVVCGGAKMIGSSTQIFQCG